jgi:outer membrane immunogenic protein
MSVRRLVLALGVLSVGSVGAMAADMPLKAPAIAPVPVYTWTGCYIGGHVGWYRARQDGDTAAFPPGFGPPAVGGAGIAGYGVLPTSHDLNDDGIIAGGHAGCNYQMGKVLFGIEGDFSWLDRNSSDAEPVTGSFPTVGAFPVAGTNMQLSASTKWLASLRARLGWVFGPSDTWLIYATGGVAFTQTAYSAVFTPSTNPASLFGNGCPGGGSCFAGTSASATQTQAGWVAGAGVEWMFGPPHWLLRVEYLHYGFDSPSSLVVPARLASGAAACAGCGWNASWSRLNIDTVRLGVSFKF